MPLTIPVNWKDAMEVKRRGNERRNGKAGKDIQR